MKITPMSDINAGDIVEHTDQEGTTTICIVVRRTYTVGIRTVKPIILVHLQGGVVIDDYYSLDELNKDENINLFGRSESVEIRFINKGGIQ